MTTISTRREEATETLHGQPISDPYRWLEDGDASEVRAWVAEQNARTERLLGAVPGRAALEARLRQLLSVGTSGMPRVAGDYCFYVQRNGDQAQPVLFRRLGVDGGESVVIDPNALDAEGLIALDWWYPSPDGSRLAYGLSRAGDEWSTLRVLIIHTGAILPDQIDRCRYSSVAWLPDSEGFYYTRYPRPGDVPPGQEEYNSHAFFHRLGTDPARDPKVFGEARDPQDMIDLAISDDGRWLVATAHQGWARSEVYLRDLTLEHGQWIPIVEGVDALFDNAIVTPETIYLRTNQNAPNGQIVTVDPTSDAPAIDARRVVVAERPERVIDGFVLAGSRLVTHELESATAHVRVYRLDGTSESELELPTLGTLTGLDGEPHSPTLLVGFTSFADAPSILAGNPRDDRLSPFTERQTATGFDPAAIEISQVTYRSKDGTPITMFVVHRHGLRLDGTNPTLLTGYGGFNISEGSRYRDALPAWLERSGVYALPNLRGGGEYGEAWHRAGMLGNKQNVFDDFAAGADWLIAEGYTRPDRLAIWGGSNGGLLIGATVTQRPDLCRAAVCAVPLLDMLRYHHFRIAKLWIPEYGSADAPDAFAWLRAYSPYHNAVAGTCYPAMLITCGEQDSRVDPMHARKMTALLQQATSCGDERPILLRAESDAGHGAGKPLAKRIAEAADEWGFLAWQLGLTWTDDS